MPMAAIDGDGPSIATAKAGGVVGAISLDASSEDLRLFSCGAADPEVVLAHMISVLRPATLSTTIERRGANCRPAVGVPPTYQLANMVGAS